MSSGTTDLENERHLLDLMSTNHIRVGVVGNVDAGKSTLVGTLISSTLDDGKGYSRQKVSKHKHEKETGQTSSIGHHTLYFDQERKPVFTKRSNDEYSIAQKSQKAITLIDLAGHEKYFKTTVAGVSVGMLDYAMLLVNSSQPPTQMTIQHMDLCCSCGIPVIVVITKADICPSHVLRHTQTQTAARLRSPEIGKKPYMVKNQCDIDIVKEKLNALIPIVTISCVKGDGLYGLDMLRSMLFELPKRRKHHNKINRQAEFLIEDVMMVKGVGVVLSGFVNAGVYQKGDDIYLGPINGGGTFKTTIRSIHVAQTNVDYAWAGHSACFAISSMPKAQRKKLLRKGMVALLNDPPELSRSFKAEVCLLKGSPVTITKGRYQTCIHVLHLKEAVRVTNIECGSKSEVVLRQGCKANLTLEFVRGEHYVRKGMRIIFRDGYVRGVGFVRETSA